MMADEENNEAEVPAAGSASEEAVRPVEGAPAAAEAETADAAAVSDAAGEATDQSAGVSVAEAPEAEGSDPESAPVESGSDDEESEGEAPEWYVLRVQAGKEDSVKRNLERKAKTEGLTDRIRRVLVPSELVSELKGKKKVVVERKLYPGYIMVQMVADEETIYHVRSTNGVGDFIGGEMNAPQPLSEREVEQMLGVAETSTEEPKLEINFKKGQNVKIKNGPFDGYSGAVDEVQPAKGAIRVIVTIFGRATPITLEYWEVESI